jgi:hypothetical protein
MALGRKQSVSHEDFIEVWRDPWRFVDRAAFVAKFAATVARVAERASRGRVGYGWSGGKDSLALEAVMREAGVTRCVLAITDLEYPAFMAWATTNMPPGLTVLNTGQDLAWLAAHPDMLFPANSELACAWFSSVQHVAQKRYFDAEKLDAIALGRRRADGNFCGRNGQDEYEEVFAAIQLKGLAMPPCYNWPRGFRVGTGPWAGRQWCGSVDNGWTEVYTIDPTIVRAAAGVLPSARAWLDARGL